MAFQWHHILLLLFSLDGHVGGDTNVKFDFWNKIIFLIIWYTSTCFIEKRSMCVEKILL